ncbi:fasciclin-2-like isoform X1 [Trichoplusia ni]|uniref:Hemolin n=2 Tax=Trichoplusia ni TaxID=7111 RepID=A0A7E5VQV7_TRINI|nr:fasciclin-2-like isoform X1 [Trichoplusia ni]
MKENFVVCIVFAIFCFRVSTACIQENFENNRSVTTGSVFYEDCCCTEPGHTVGELLWLDPNNKVIQLGRPGTSLNVYTEEQGECLSLFIQELSKTMAGTFRCVAHVDGSTYTQKHNIDVYDQLYFFNTPLNQYIVHNNDSLITCEAKGASPPFIRWYRGKDGQHEITNDTIKYQFMPTGLIIKNVNNDDDGIYKCSASVLSTGEEVEEDIDVKVMTPPMITDLSASPGAVVTAGEPVTIQCNAEGLPEPEFIWKKPENNSEENNSTSSIIVINNTIRFSSIEAEDAGTYECIARNFVGSATKSIDIVVHTYPEIIDFLNITATEGDQIPMYCNATGIPEPNITITYEGKSWDDERETEYDEEIPNFSLLTANRSKAGIYVCNASNSVDMTTEAIYLTVLHKPYFVEPIETLWGWSGERINISCAHESNPPSNTTWMYWKGNFSTIGNEDMPTIDSIVLDYDSQLEHSFLFTDQFAPYGKHECKAKNEIGETIKAYYIRKGFPPGPVLNATTIVATATSATFEIEPPSSNDGPSVIGYIAEYDEANNYDVTNIHPNRTWAIGIPFKLEKLRPNTTYHIRFAAINRVGAGHWSDTVEFDTMDKSAPEPPIWQVDALQISSSKVLKWREPEDNGEPIDYYVLRYCQMTDSFDEGACTEVRLDAATELEVKDLQHNSTYYFELIAHNVEGNSTPANFSLTIPASMMSEDLPAISAGAVIGIAVIIIVLAIVLIDLLLFFWRKQGMIASCCSKKNKKRKPSELNSRDKKGLLKDNGESGTDDTLRRPNNGHKEYEYNKTTGIITGKHSSV